MYSPPSASSASHDPPAFQSKSMGNFNDQNWKCLPCFVSQIVSSLFSDRCLAHFLQHTWWIYILFDVGFFMPKLCIKTTTSVRQLKNPLTEGFSVVTLPAEIILRKSQQKIHTWPIHAREPYQTKLVLNKTVGCWCAQDPFCHNNTKKLMVTMGSWGFLADLGQSWVRRGQPKPEEASHFGPFPHPQWQ